MHHKQAISGMKPLNSTAQARLRVSTLPSANPQAGTSQLDFRPSMPSDNQHPPCPQVRGCAMRRPAFLSAAMAALLLTCSLRSARADEGMWLLNRPPRELLSTKYKFDLDDAWLKRA